MLVSTDLRAGQVPEYDLKLLQFVFVASRSQRLFPDFFCPAETVGLHGPEHDPKLPHLFAADLAAIHGPEYDFKLLQFVFVVSRSLSVRQPWLSLPDKHPCLPCHECLRGFMDAVACLRCARGITKPFRTCTMHNRTVIAEPLRALVCSRPWWERICKNPNL